MNKKIVIVSGGSIDAPFALERIKEIEPDIIIGVDRGLTFLYENQVLPTHIVGDFDSIAPEVIAYYKERTKIPIREFNPVKDASDTEIAVRFSIELGAKEIWLLGATGTRLDHVMANIQVLKIAHDAGVKAYIADQHNRISLIEKYVLLQKKEAFGKYFSLFTLGSKVDGLNIEGAKYPLKDYTLFPDNSRCVSNEFLENEVKISFSEGIAILMETRD